MKEALELFEEFKEIGEARQPVEIYNDGSTSSVELDNWQLAILIQGLKKAMPLFNAENKPEIAEELSRIVAELEA